MKVLNKVNLSLLVILILLIGLNFWPTNSGYHPLSNIDAKDIVTISLTQANGHSINFIKENSDWLFTHNKEVKLDQDKINKLLGILITHQYRRFENTKQNREAFDLDKPRYQIKLNNTEILFGTTEPIEHLRYILIKNDIYLITDLYLQYLQANEDSFIKSS